MAQGQPLHTAKTTRQTAAQVLAFRIPVWLFWQQLPRQ
nr:MAG TPA: hypothetical protein [Caudoviricetes sp.]